LRYAYEAGKSFAFNLNYLTVLYDNIAITDGGVAYGAGVSYFYSKRLGLNFTNFIQITKISTYIKATSTWTIKRK